MWKKNLLEDLESEEVEFRSAGEFSLELKKEFGGGDKELVKIVELKKKKIEQGGKIMEEFVQEFRRAARGSRYKERVLVEEFKRVIKRVIRRKLMEAERSLISIEQ